MSDAATGSDFFFELPPHPKTTFDEKEFLRLLEGSLSLSIEEKRRVIDSVPTLGQTQIEELMMIFREEQERFAALGEKAKGKIESLKTKRDQEFVVERTKQEEQTASASDADEAAALRASLGL